MRFSVITPTHDSKWLADTWASLQSQTFTDFEWVVMVNDRFGSRGGCEQNARNVRKIVGDDKRVRIAIDQNKFIGIGATKKKAFSQGHGEILVELDHDDILLPDALAELDKAFEDDAVGFAYSDFADFEGSVKEGQGVPITYMTDPGRRRGWLDTGYRFYTESLGGVRPGLYECVRALPATGAYVSHIYTAPNHIRAWRKSVYDEVGGHSEKYVVADDAELMIRTYMAARFFHITKPLYLYRISDKNSWARNVAAIKETSDNLMAVNMEKLVSVWCEREGKKRLDLSTDDVREGWEPGTLLSISSSGEEMEEGSVGVIRASDFLCRHADKELVMNGIWRMLCEGGILLSDTPSTDGRGAFQDPSNIGYWNENSFWYWTKPEYRRFLKRLNQGVVFRTMCASTYFPSQFHTENKIPYVRAWLVAVKEQD